MSERNSRRLAVTLLGLAVTSVGFGFVSNRSAWPDGTVQIELQLGAPGRVLVDGTTSWNALALDVLATWNAAMERTQLVGVDESEAPQGGDNGFNNVFFSDEVYGDEFGDALGITLTWVSNGQNRRESDIIMNSTYAWDSYRGELFQTTEDFRRVFLHEVGHLLGVGHPDEALQVVDALMNSFISDIDELQADDLAGVKLNYDTDGPEGGLGNNDDHGGLFATATPVSIGQVLTGRLNPWDFDFFRIEVAAESALLTSTSGETDTYGTVYDAEGRLLAFNNDSGADANFSTITVLPGGGTYYVLVEGVFGETAGDYTLDITINDDPTNGDQAGDRPELATDFGLNETQNRAINYSGDVDYFRLELTQPGRLTVFSTGEQDLLAAVFDSNDEVESIDDDAGEGRNFLIRTGILQPGTYFLQVSTILSGDIGDYGLVTQFEVIDGESSMGARLANLSVLTSAGGEAGPVIMGFVTTVASKSLLIRAVGPGLRRFEVTGYLPDPKFTLFDTAAIELESNDDWVSADNVFQLIEVSAGLGAFELGSDLDSALVTTRKAGAYTVKVEDTEGRAGKVLVEAYDGDALGSPSRLVNVSTRTQIGIDGGLLTAGFVVEGEGMVRLLIRGIGPELGVFGVSGSLPDPALKLFNSAQELAAENDDWDPTSADLSEAMITVGAFPLSTGSKDAAFVIEIESGAYTVQLSSADGEVGQGLVEIYEIP